MFKQVNEDGILPQTLNEAVITLIPKKGDLEEIGSYRPTSLLNTDQNNLSKTLARRLMNKLVHADQTGFIARRSSFVNLKRLFNIMHSSRFLKDCVILSLDTKKVFLPLCNPGKVSDAR